MAPQFARQMPPPTHPAPPVAAEIPRRDAFLRTGHLPVDRSLPPPAPGTDVADSTSRFLALKDCERRFDALVVRKRLELNDSSKSTPPTQSRILRISISNTVANQPWQDTAAVDPFDTQTYSPAPTFRVRIEGRLLDNSPPAGSSAADDQEQEGHDGSPRKSSDQHQSGRLRFSNLMNQISVDFGSPSRPVPHIPPVSWSRPGHQTAVPDSQASSKADFDFIEIERKSDTTIEASFNLFRNHLFQERFAITPSLAKLLDSESDERSTILMNLWQYLKSQGLEPDGRAEGEEVLRQLFDGQDSDPIYRHLSPALPVNLKYTIRVDRQYNELAPDDPARYTIYDIPVQSVMFQPNSAPPLLRLSSTPPVVPAHPLVVLQSIIHLDGALAAVVRSIKEAKPKSQFFDHFSRDPVGVVLRWISSQRHELAVIMGELIHDNGLDPRTRLLNTSDPESPFDPVWDSDRLHEAISLMSLRPKRVGI